MQYKDLILGILMAIAASALGSFIFIEWVAGLDFVNGFLFYKSHGLLGKIITLGAVLNLIIFFNLTETQQRPDGAWRYFGHDYTDGHYVAYLKSIADEILHYCR